MRHHAIIVGLLVISAGCGSNQSGQQIATNPAIVGKWKKGNSELEFTGGSTVILHQGSSQQVGKYEWKIGLLKLSDREGDNASFGVEVVSGNLVLRPEPPTNYSCDFYDVGGTWQGNSGRAAPVEEAGPLAEARARVAKFETKRMALAPLLAKAIADRNDVVAKLRGVGVTSVADLKGNVQAQSLAASLQRIGGEIDGLEHQRTALDSAILAAKAVVRRLERERAGISEEEMKMLAEQLRDVEDRTDRVGTQPLTPLDIDAALAKALASSSGSESKSTEVHPTNSGAESFSLVGDWVADDPPASKMPRKLTFTKGGSALLTLFGVTGPPATYKQDGTKLELTAESRTEAFRLDFVSDREVIIAASESDHGSVRKTGFSSPLAGRWKRTN